MIEIAAWIFPVLLFLGLSGLLTLYVSGSFRHHRTYHLQGVPAIHADNFLPTVISLSDSFSSQGKITNFWVQAEEIFAARLSAIQQAQQNICFETYIMTPGQRADTFADALIERAHAGVVVQVMVDSYGTRTIPQRYWQRLRAAGIAVRFFNPFDGRAPFDYFQRNHRKLLLIDHTCALIGGAGISDLWDGTADTGSQPWFDFEVRVKGSVVSLLYGLFTQHWLDSGGTVDLEQQPIKVAAKSPEDLPMLVTTGDDPSLRNAPIRALLQICILAAQERIWIASPYWLPNHNICRMLIKAKHRGIDVKVLTAGSNTDKPPIYHISQTFYGELLQAGIQLYEYLPSMMHAKAILIDHHWVSLGSANVDPRSLFQNDELNLSSSEPIHQLEQFFQTGFDHSYCVQYHQWKKRLWHQKLRGHLGRLVYWQL